MIPARHQSALAGAFLLAAILAMPPVPAGGRPVRQQSPGDGLLALTAGADGTRCTAERRWCVSLEAGEADGQTVRPVVRTGSADAALALPTDPMASETHAPWPYLLPLADGGFLAGVETEIRTAYSGGGGSARELRLFRVGADGRALAEPLLTVPVHASLLIRACFSEDDQKKRRGACHDEYDFSGTITPAPERAAGLPVLLYDTEATAFPAPVSRASDSTTARPLRKADLVRRRDPHCSVTRRFTFDPQRGTYTPDSPLPECTEYTVP